MAKATLAVFAATGNQGNSVANFVLDDPELSQRYTVRAIARNTSKAPMQALKSKGAELAQADLDDPASLPAVLKGADFIFFMTTTQFQGGTREAETKQAKALCSEAVTQGVKYIIYSSMGSGTKISQGKLTTVEHFDTKAEIEEYIRGLPVKSAFFAPGNFMQNFSTNMMMPQPSPANDGTFVLGDVYRDDTVIPLIDITDTGKYIGAILADPEKYEGKFFAGAGELIPVADACAIVSKVSGKTVKHMQLPDEVFKDYLPAGMAEMVTGMGVLQREYGYFGSDQVELVEWSRDNARGNITGLEEFLTKVNYKL